MTQEQSAAFILAQVEMMRSERAVMESEDEERVSKGLSPANGPEQWNNFMLRWQPILGYNELLMFFSEANKS